MSEIEANKAAPTAPQDDEEEFEIIQEDGNDEEVVREPASSVSDDGAVRMTYVDKSVPPSECTDVGDLGDAFDGKSVCSDTPSSNAARLLESIYATPYADSAHVDKLVEMLRGEYEQNRSVLDNISKMVADLYKEKHDNAELRVELEGYKQRCEKLHETIGDLHDKLIEKDDAASKNEEDYERVLLKMDTLKFNQDEKEAVICELQEAFYKLSAENESANNTLAKAQEELDALRLREKEKDRKLTVLAEEMEKKCCELENKSAENADLKQAMEEMQKELLALKKESVNHAEIIRIVQEENTEATRAYTEARKEYREKLDALEQQWIRRQVTRNEIRPAKRSRNSKEPPDQHSTPSNLHRYSALFVCERCLNAFPTNGFLVYHRSYCS